MIEKDVILNVCKKTLSHNYIYRNKWWQR